jgi:hypothetical protein
MPSVAVFLKVKKEGNFRGNMTQELGQDLGN